MNPVRYGVKSNFLHANVSGIFLPPRQNYKAFRNINERPAVVLLARPKAEFDNRAVSRADSLQFEAEELFLSWIYPCSPVLS